MSRPGRASPGLEADERDREAPSNETLLAVSDLEKHYGEESIFGESPVRALDGVSLTVDRGETVAVVGESGSGKTTLGRSIARLDRPTDGTVVFDGEDVTAVEGDALREYRRRCQLVFQDPDSSLNERMTVGEILAEPLAVNGIGSRAERRQRALALLDAVGLAPEHFARYPHQFSGGQRQRIAIARALALEPDLLVLDEPVSALDVSVQAQILGLLEELQEDFDLSYLLITHDLGVVRAVADRTLVMYLGRVMERGRTDAVFDDQRNPYTETLLSAIPEPDPSVPLDPIGLGGSPPDPRSPPTGCPFAPRCPAKIREDEVPVEPSVRERLDAFREVLRQRSAASSSLGGRLARLLGRDPGRDLATVREELLDGLDPAPPVRAALDEVENRYRDRGPAAAIGRFDETFGSVCDREEPDLHGASGRESRCHRHREGYADPDAVQR